MKRPSYIIGIITYLLFLVGCTGQSPATLASASGTPAPKHPVWLMCRLIGVSRSGFYSRLGRGAELVSLCVIMDLASREIVGWQIALTMYADLVCDALVMAVDNRGRAPRGAIFQSDQG